MNDPTRSIVKIWSGMDWPVQNSVNNPTTRKNMAVRPLMISASSENPVIRLASQDRNSLRRSQLAASLSRAVDCLASVMSSITALPGAVDAGAGGAAGAAGSASAAVLASRRGVCLTGATSALALSASAMTAAARIVGVVVLCLSLTTARRSDLEPRSFRRGMRGCSCTIT
ncbi:unnamed protein product [Pelagomonas calceolata]|uniref:Uncharacterized protein n=1 Tax=Pelagomonas calceolata TaxID=35677 RepID=A0A8J2S6A7_9STRA|nr:unnamed protein product [Pelagomonas calceolata]